MAQGGRYDEIGQVFGRASPATGFSTDLATLLWLGASPEVAAAGIYAPPVGDAGLEEQVVALRGQGERVIRALPGAVWIAAGFGMRPGAGATGREVDRDPVAEFSKSYRNLTWARM